MIESRYGDFESWKELALFQEEKLKAQQLELEKARELIKDLIGHGEAIIQFPHKEKVSFVIVMENAKEFLKIKEGDYE